MAINKIKANALPRWSNRGLTHVDMRIVRPIDVNGVIDAINAEFVTTNANVSTNTADIATNTSAIATINGAAPVYAEVSMTAAQILAADGGGSGAFELLPALTGGRYYVFEEIVVEYTHVSTNYSGGAGGDFELTQGGYPIGLLDRAMFETIGANNYMVLKGGSANNDTTPSSQLPFVAGAVTIQHQDLNGWSAGDGTVLFKFKYFPRTPGTEL